MYASKFSYRVGVIPRPLLLLLIPCLQSNSKQSTLGSSKAKLCCGSASTTTKNISNRLTSSLQHRKSKTNDYKKSLMNVLKIKMVLHHYTPLGQVALSTLRKELKLYGFNLEERDLAAFFKSVDSDHNSLKFILTIE